MHAQTWRIARQTPVCDHANTLLYRADRNRALELLARNDVDVIANTSRVKGLRLRGPDPALRLSGSHRRRGIGQPHANESYYNVKGVWHLDRIPESLRERFVAVVTDCVRA